jgi:hypothetical protein
MSASLPDHGIGPTVPTGQRIVEMIVSPDGTERNYITVDAGGVFRVCNEYWNTFVDEPGHEYWDGGGPSHFTDSLEIARRHASLGMSDSPLDNSAA